MRRQIREERDGHVRAQHGLEPVPSPAIPVPRGVEEGRRPPLQRGGAGRRGGGGDVEAVHRHAWRIGVGAKPNPNPRRPPQCVRVGGSDLAWGSGSPALFARGVEESGGDDQTGGEARP